MSDSCIGAATGEFRGIPAAEPILQLTFDVEACGLSDGAPALFLIGGSMHADSGRNLGLGTAAPVLRQLGFSYGSAASHTDPYLRDITWHRENAVLALGMTASLAQLISPAPERMAPHATS